MKNSIGMDEVDHSDELEIGSADYKNATFKPKKLEVKRIRRVY